VIVWNFGLLAGASFDYKTLCKTVYTYLLSVPWPPGPPEFGGLEELPKPNAYTPAIQTPSVFVVVGIFQKKSGRPRNGAGTGHNIHACSALLSLSRPTLH